MPRRERWVNGNYARENNFTELTNGICKNQIPQSAEAVEYTDSTSAEE